ncbi:hypothetical protein FOT62_22650 [Serratia marcescens]|uniref:Uncharacterized protein n=1 Tax=Serratia marcescens TaxID=615 RepID=A0A5C7BXT6_SERMA|nr:MULTISPECIES: hypothetical protein [Serratia]TXE27122.1 hypothetical protein FOT62_22650 [Serratia marcescens]TXE55321.1 hypothetical protein FOT56_25515 [Serratia marcescens]
MVNQFNALAQARDALEAQGCVVRSYVRKPQRPVITADSTCGQIVWPTVDVVVRENGVQRTVRTSRVHECQVIWN